MFRRGLPRGKSSGDRKNNEPEYEEVGPPPGLKKNQEKRGDGQHCDLCGSSEAAVRCDRCGSQAFCLSCDDMYHRHPRRSAHVRKAVDSLNVGGGGVRPPLPPKGEMQSVPPPQPPPRKNKRAGFLSNNKRDQNDSGNEGGTRYSLALPIRKPSSASSEAGGTGRTIMGSLKRFMGARPLPPTPDQTKGNSKLERPSSSAQKILTRANTSPSLPNLNDPLTNEDIRTGLPQSVLDINRTLHHHGNSTSTPATPASAHAQYPPLQPKAPPSQSNTQSLGRKFSLQQLPQGFDDKRTSMVEGTPGSVPWEGEAPKPATRNRSQSVSDDQWAQMMAAQVPGGNTEIACPPGHTPADMSAFAGATTRRSYNTMGGGGRSASSLGRSMVSSASVCDLNSLAQQQTQHGFNNSHAANSFQQLNMMGYNNGMMWGGAPCDLCPPMYPGHPNFTGMKRTGSNLSMNLSSVGSDGSSYPWGPPPPHMHHHMPPMYPGYYPGYHPHMGQPPMGSGMGLNMSIPDSMHTFGKVPSSPAPSLRSSSHRSHKSTKSRSFSAADTSGRSSRARKLKRSEESEESRSSSVSDDEDLDERNNKPGHTSSSLAWQCDHCTFINSGGARTCGMCSKTVGSNGRSSRKNSERRRSDRRRDRRTDHEDDDRDLSDYDNDGVVKSNLSFNIKDSKRDTRTKVSGSNRNKSKKKSRRRGSSPSGSDSGSEGEDERLERHMRDLRLSSSSSRRRGSDYEGINHKDKDRERERSSRKKEGSGRFKNRGKGHSERSRTPGRQTPRRASPVDDLELSGEGSLDSNPIQNGQGHLISNENDLQDSVDETVVDPAASEVTMKSEKKSRSGSRDRRKEIKKERAPTPPPSPVEEIVQEPKALPQDKLNADKSRSCSPKLRVQNGRSPARSLRNSKGDIDEPSFANTLDDIVTMGTNEVADQDLSQFIDDQPQSTVEQLPIEEPHEDVPVVTYIRDKSPEEEIPVEDIRPITNDTHEVVEIEEPTHIKEPEVITVNDTRPAKEKENVALDSVYEPSYEPIEEPVQIEESALPKPDQLETRTPSQNRDMKEDADETLDGMAVDRITKSNENKQESPLVARSASSGSSLGPSSPPERDRQYTPLSCSSSDAQFYSPPDSPDLSLSDQLRDVPMTSQTQAFTVQQDSRKTSSQTIRNRDDDYLVTALETMQTARTGEDLKSSRETIRSSLEQLPYSEEAFEGDKDEPPPRPASAGAVPESQPDDGYIYGYDSYSFKDALTVSGADKIARSASATDLLLSSSVVGDSSAKEMSSGIVSLQEEADRQARAAAWSKDDLSEKYMTVEEIITKRRQKVMETQGLQLVQILRDAEDAGYSSEEVSIALTHCGDKSPLEWLKENWRHMVDTVLTLATNYGNERQINDIGSITAPEARIALRLHKGNIWAAVTECVEQRQKKAKSAQKTSPAPTRPAPEEIPPLPVSAKTPAQVVQPVSQTTQITKVYSSGSGEAKKTSPPGNAVTSNRGSSSQSAKPSSKKNRKYSSTLNVSLSTQKKISEHTTGKVPSSLNSQTPLQDLRTPDGYESISTPFEEKERVAAAATASTDSSSVLTKMIQPESKSAPTSARNSLLLDDYEVSDDDDESVSITTGRLSLSLSAASINVKSEVIQTSQVPATDHEQDLKKEGPAEISEKGTEYQSVEHEVDASIEANSADLEDQENQNNLDDQGVAQTKTGPVTVQKASVIVGKAIAKAMARETSVRESMSRSVTPEVQDTTLTTPEPSASEGEEEPIVQVTLSDSDDEDHLRTLDTIPEEEEISDRTESRVSRSASRNQFLPFNPTDIINLSPVAKALNMLTGSKKSEAKPKKPKTLALKKGPLGGGTSSNDSTPGTPHDYYNTAQPLNVETTNANDYYNQLQDENSYYNQTEDKNNFPDQTKDNNSYYNQSGDKVSYYNQSGGPNNYYNEGNGDKIEGAISEVEKSLAPNDYESMAEVKDTKTEMSVEATISVTSKTPEPDLDNDDYEVIYYEEVILKTDEGQSHGATSGPPVARKRRRRKRKGHGHAAGVINAAGTSSHVDVVDSHEAASSEVLQVSPIPEEINIPLGDPNSKTGDAETKIYENKVYSTVNNVKRSQSNTSMKMEAGSSNYSGKEERKVGEAAETVSEDERLKVPNLLVQIEGLKARHNKETDYQEVRELKEQIQMMRKQLEAKMEEEEGSTRPNTPETPQEEHPPKGPQIVLQESPTMERPPSREYEQLQFDRTVRRLLAEGQAGSYEKAELAAQLMNFNFDELDSLSAAEECSSIYTAIQFLQQECELCAEKYPMGKMVSMLQCIHRCCRECAKTYFTFQIKTKNIRDLRCPFCNEPDLDECEEIANEYLNNMDILLKNILDAETHELFQRKLRDWTLMKDPNFRWCNKCSSGFIANPRARKLICPDCKDVTCAHCRATWEAAHEGISCYDFERWKADNDLEVQAQGVARHLAENGITCPKCKFTYSLAKGGCMHFTCTQCKYEFCSGCGQPFRQGSKCPVGPYCERLGLHAHHPRNCLFYLRDKEPHQLQNLLKEAGIEYDTESHQEIDNPSQKKLCLVQEQKELPDGLKDDICGRIVPEGYAGLCRLHYTEYLVEKINMHKLDPVNIFDEADLRVCLRRNGKPVPVRRWESEKLYRDKLIKLIKEHLPLDALDQ